MSFFRSLAREALDFFEFVGDALGSDLARKALIRDLGGDPAAPAPSRRSRRAGSPASAPTPTAPTPAPSRPSAC